MKLIFSTEHKYLKNNCKFLGKLSILFAYGLTLTANSDQLALPPQPVRGGNAQVEAWPRNYPLNRATQECSQQVYGRLNYKPAVSAAHFLPAADERCCLLYAKVKTEINKKSPRVKILRWPQQASAWVKASRVGESQRENPSQSFDTIAYSCSLCPSRGSLTRAR